MSSNGDTSFILGPDIVETEFEKATRELREANILNFRTDILSNNSRVIIFEGSLPEGAAEIVRANGFRRRE